MIVVVVVRMEEEKVGRGSQTVEGPRPRWGETKRKVSGRERGVKETASKRTQGAFCLCLPLSKGPKGTKERIDRDLSSSTRSFVLSSSSNSSSPFSFASFCTHREIVKDEKGVIGSAECSNSVSRWIMLVIRIDDRPDTRYDPKLSDRTNDLVDLVTRSSWYYYNSNATLIWLKGSRTNRSRKCMYIIRIKIVIKVHVTSAVCLWHLVVMSQNKIRYSVDFFLIHSRCHSRNRCTWSTWSVLRSSTIPSKALSRVQFGPSIPTIRHSPSNDVAEICSSR